MPAYSPYSVALLFIRSASAAASTDDSLKVCKNFQTGEFNMIYTDSHDVSKKNVHKLQGLYRQRILDHIYLTLKNLTMDKEGFFQLEVIVPGMPLFLVNVADLKDLYYRDHILELVANGLDNLDVLEVTKATVPAPVPAPAPAPAPVPLAAEEDEYADMPPLIPISQAQNARRVLASSMDRFLYTQQSKPLEQRRSERLAQRCNQSCNAPCGGPTRRHLFFNQDDEDDHEDY